MNNEAHLSLFNMPHSNVMVLITLILLVSKKLQNFAIFSVDISRILTYDRSLQSVIFDAF